MDRRVDIGVWTEQGRDREGEARSWHAIKVFS